jgi:hypothetical protein
MLPNTFPPILELLCMLLFLVFVVGLAYMGLTVSRSPSPGVRTTIETVRDPPSLVTAVVR